MKPSRPRNGPPRKYGILIQCEGRRTEPRYLDAFCRDCGAKQRFNVQVRPGRGMNAVVTVGAALRESGRTVLGARVYDEVWCVLDVEHAGHEASLTAALALAGRHNIKVCLSNPCFEVWLIAHFEAVARPFADCGAAERHLAQRHWQTVSGTGYDKADTELYGKLAGRLTAAVDNARAVLEGRHGGGECRDCNSSTEVYKLVQRLTRAAP